MWENASSYLGSGFSRGTGHLQQQFLSRDGVVTGMGGTRPHPGETCRLAPGESKRVWSAGMMGFNEKRKQGRQASLSILGVKLQSPGRQRLWRQEPYAPYYSARYSPSIPGHRVRGFCRDPRRLRRHEGPGGAGSPGSGVRLSRLFDFDLGAFSLKLGLDLLGLSLRHLLLNRLRGTIHEVFGLFQA